TPKKKNLLRSALLQLGNSSSNLVLLDEFQDLVWSTHIARSATPDNSVIAVLRDDGNLILSDVSNSSTLLILWQSFDYPTHTILPGAKLGYDKRTQIKQVLISWKNWNDRAPGLIPLELDPRHAQFVIKWNRTIQYWASGSWNGQTFNSVTEMRLNYIYNYNYTDNENESYFTYSQSDSSIMSRLIMDVSGQIKQHVWLTNSSGWNPFWTQPRQQCNVYANCGAFGICNNANSSCNCLSSFKSISDKEWFSNDYSGGCVRGEKMQCNVITEDSDNFWMNSSVRLPDSQDSNITVTEASQCRYTCFNNCSCTAYAYDGFGSCSIWTGELFNLQLFSEMKQERLYLSNVAPLKKNRYSRDTQISHWHNVGRGAKVLMNENNDEVIDVPYFHLETILAVTDNFSNRYKLGQEGLGPVSEGIFPDGKEIAVKRLSSHSRQGIDEFKNEAWRLWIEERAMHLTEKSLLESCNRSEVIKCISVALLCVQEDSNDRPNMSDIIITLVGEGMSLERPNRPAFVISVDI
ncbi:hypothetical protein HAX54_028525, partial [Datura stramonium]|nr:hypothetical protein [Datura stramonium]